MWHRLKNSMQAATISLALVFTLMAGGTLEPASTAEPSSLPTTGSTLTGMAPEAEQLVIAIAAKLAAAAIDEALGEQPSAMGDAPATRPTVNPTERRAGSNAGLRQRIPFFSFAARPNRGQGS